MIATKSNVVVFMVHSTLPSAFWKVQLVLSFADKEQVFDTTEVTKNWHFVALTLPFNKSRSGFTYHARKEGYILDRRGNFTKIIHEEIKEGSLVKSSNLNVTQLYTWKFNEERNCQAMSIPSQMNTLALSVCRNAPAGKVAAHSEPGFLTYDSSHTYDAVALSKGCYVTLLPLGDDSVTSYTWMNTKKSIVAKKAKTVFEFSKKDTMHQRHMWPVAKGYIRYGCDKWGKFTDTYKCVEIQTLSTAFQKHVQRLSNIYNRKTEVFYSPRICLLEDLDKYSIMEEDESAICNNSICHTSDIVQQHYIENNIQYIGTPIKIQVNKLTTFRKTLVRFFWEMIDSVIH